MFRLILQPDELNRLKAAWQPVYQQNENVAFFCRQQVEERFRSQGASSGKPWAPKGMKKLGYDDGRSILTGPSGLLRRSWFTLATLQSATVFCDLPYAAVQQLGTVGKGGTLKDIVPIKAKALFIPITDRAISSQRHDGETAMRIRSVYGFARPSGPVRLATTGPKAGKGIHTKAFAAGLDIGTLYRGLVKGRIKDGHLEAWDERKGEWDANKTPDFIFLRKVSIPPRPMLPDSPAEQEEQRKFVAECYAPNSVWKTQKYPEVVL